MSTVREAYFARLGTLPSISSPLRRFVSIARNDRSSSSSPLTDPLASTPSHTLSPPKPACLLESWADHPSTAIAARGRRYRRQHQLQRLIVCREAYNSLPEEADDNEGEFALLEQPNSESSIMENKIWFGGDKTQEDLLESVSNSHSGPEVVDGESSDDDDRSDDVEPADDGDDNFADDDEDDDDDDSGERQSGDGGHCDGNLAIAAQTALYEVDGPPGLIDTGFWTWGYFAVPSVQNTANQSNEAWTLERSEECDIADCFREGEAGATKQSADVDGDSNTSIPHLASAEQMGRRRIAPMKRRLHES